ncbi:MAG: hypothetical protein FJ333_08530 [Sphingomonadales bacterium]|nr:hypothetical protein [Sphingomonadales bacterium]
MNSDDEVEQPAAAATAAGQSAAAAAPSQHPKFFKLPNFWVASPVAWFGVAEVQFALRGVTSQRVSA